MSTSSLVLLSVNCFLLATALANADTIAGRTGGTAFEDLAATATVSWTQISTYSNLSVAGDLLPNYGTADIAGTAYLTTRIGPGTTTADELARATIHTANIDANKLSTLFSGLTLGPGTYFVTTSFTPGQGGLSWYYNYGNTDVSTPGNTTGTDSFSPSYEAAPYPPAGGIYQNHYDNFDFLVSGTPTPGTPAAVTPEPATLTLLGSGLLGLSGILRRRQG